VSSHVRRPKICRHPSGSPRGAESDSHEPEPRPHGFDARNDRGAINTSDLADCARLRTSMISDRDTSRLPEWEPSLAFPSSNSLSGAR
jgi:hypothetical protein